MLAAKGVDVKEKVPASRKLGESEAQTLIRQARKIYIAKGRSLETFAGGRASRDLIEKFLGSTGNLRAPTAVAGKTVIVGFNADVYEELFG